MPTVLLFAGLGLAAGGTITQVVAAQKANDYQQKILEEQEKQERIRKNAMELEARRKQMEQLRVMQNARAMALTSANAQGASFGSGLQGGYGQISGQGGSNYSGVEQSAAIGGAIFNSNAAITGYQGGLANAQTLGSFGTGMTSLGTTMMGAFTPARAAFGGGYGGASGSYGTYGAYGSRPWIGGIGHA